jgi:hypothetical protein
MRCDRSSTSRSRPTARASPTLSRRRISRRTSTTPRCSSCRPRAARRRGSARRCTSSTCPRRVRSSGGRRTARVCRCSASANGRPEVFGVDPTSGAAAQLTHAPDGVIAYEWAPDAKAIAFITVDPMPRRKSAAPRRSIVRDRGRRTRPRRRASSWSGRQAAAMRTLTPPSAVRRRAVVVARRPRDRVLRRAAHGIFGGVRRADSTPSQSRRRDPHDRRSRRHEHRAALLARRPIDRVHLHRRPRDIMASRSLTIVPAAGGAPRVFAIDDAWVNEYVWTPDSRSIYVAGERRHVRRGAHMFEQPIVRVSVARRPRRADRHGTDGRVLDRAQPRRPAPRVQVGGRAVDGRRARDGRRRAAGRRRSPT